jgi:hypothetical protein
VLTGTVIVYDEELERMQKEDTTLMYAWRHWGKLQSISIEIVSVLAEIQTGTSQIEVRNDTTWMNLLRDCMVSSQTWWDKESYMYLWHVIYC